MEEKEMARPTPEEVNAVRQQAHDDAKKNEYSPPVQGFATLLASDKTLELAGEYDASWKRNK